MIKYVEISLPERLKLLDATRVFNSLDHDALENLARLMGEITYQTGQTVVAEGDEADRLFIIIDGRAEVSVSSTGEKVILAVLEKGELFGEMAFFAKEQRRQATVTAITGLHLLFLDVTVFKDFIATRPAILNAVKEIAEARMKVDFLKQFSPLKSLSPERITILVSRQP